MGKIKMINNGYLDVKSKVKGKSELIIFGEITSNKWAEEEVDPSEVRELLETIDTDDDLDIYINSIGGNFMAGIAIYNMLQRHKGHKRVFIEGVAASIASVIAMVGDEIIIPANAHIMIHKSWNLVCGNADMLREKAEQFDRFDSIMAQAYLTRAIEGITEERFLELMKAETWLQGVEAQAYFKVKLDEASDVVACLDGGLYKKYKLPNEFLKSNFQPKAMKNKKDDFGTSEMENLKAKMRLELELMEG